MKRQRSVFIFRAADGRSTHEQVFHNERAVDAVWVRNHTCGPVIAANVGSSSQPHAEPQRSLDIETAQVCPWDQGRAGVEMRRGEATINIVFILYSPGASATRSGARLRPGLVCAGGTACASATLLIIQPVLNSPIPRRKALHFRAATPNAFNQTSANCMPSNP